jgi:hypothetical protein
LEYDKPQIADAELAKMTVNKIDLVSRFTFMLRVEAILLPMTLDRQAGLTTAMTQLRLARDMER